MDATANSKESLPSWHVSEAIGRPHSTRASAPYEIRDALCRNVQCNPFDGAEILKWTPYVADLKRAGRFIAKDMFEGGDVPLLMRTLLDPGELHDQCASVT